MHKLFMTYKKLRYNYTIKKYAIKNSSSYYHQVKIDRETNNKIIKQ